MATNRFYPSTLIPPDDDDDAATAETHENLPWVLLEHLPFVAKRENATTAWSDTPDGMEIQVTLCPRRPPRVSYVCVHSPRDDIATEPEIIATEDDLIVLRVTLGDPEDKYVLTEIENLHYYVYQADDGSGRPSLKHLPRPPCRTSFDARDMGVLRYVTHHQQREYIIAGIVQENYELFTLYLYDSGQGADWKIHTVTLSHQPPQQYAEDDYFYHKNCKVMAIGGPDATMAFVDLWRGILFCDIRKLQSQHQAAARGEAIPVLSYLPLPSSLDKDKEPRGDARLWRNIAVIQGRLKYVELHLHRKPSLYYEGQYTHGHGWMAATFSRPAPASSSSLDVDGDSCWRQDCYMDSNKTDFSNDPRLKLLPKACSYEGRRRMAPPFQELHIRQPVLALQEGADIIFFTTKVGTLSDDAWVVAVDMRNKAISGVAAFSASRVIGANFAYIHSRISKYLKKSPSIGIPSD